MSNLTKALIVLLTIAVVFLSAMVVTYVSSADDYKQMSKNTNTELGSLKKKNKDYVKQINDQETKIHQLEQKLKNQIASLQNEVSKLKNDLKSAERENASLLQKVTGFASEVETFTQTNRQQGVMLEKKLEELTRIQADQIKERKQLDEISAYLDERLAIIDTLEGRNKRLVEEKTELQANLNQFLGGGGKVAVVRPVTREVDTTQPARRVMPAVRSMNLKGLITDVDMKNSMASISLGAADGVKEGMKFYVSRGDEFICSILVIDIEAEEAVGVLELIQQQPRVGDNVSTNL